MLKEKSPKPPLAVALFCKIVGLEVVDQQTPLSSSTSLPEADTEPPVIAVLKVMPVTGAVWLTTGALISGNKESCVQPQQEKTAIKKIHFIIIQLKHDAYAGMVIVIL